MGVLTEKAEALQNNPSIGRLIGIVVEICKILDKQNEQHTIVTSTYHGIQEADNKEDSKHEEHKKHKK